VLEKQGQHGAIIACLARLESRTVAWWSLCHVHTFAMRQLESGRKRLIPARPLTSHRPQRRDGGLDLKMITE